MNSKLNLKLCISLMILIMSVFAKASSFQCQDLLLNKQPQWERTLFRFSELAPGLNFFSSLEQKLALNTLQSNLHLAQLNYELAKQTPTSEYMKEVSLRNIKTNPKSYPASGDFNLGNPSDMNADAKYVYFKLENLDIVDISSAFRQSDQAYRAHLQAQKEIQAFIDQIVIPNFKNAHSIQRSYPELVLQRQNSKLILAGKPLTQKYEWNFEVQGDWFRPSK